MGAITSSETKKNLDFNDDCFLRVPGHDKNREKFNQQMNERRRKREEYEQETENIRIKQMEAVNNFVAGFLKGVGLNLKWKMTEDEWSNWLKTLRSLVARAKIQFLSLEVSVNSYGIEDEELRIFIEEALEKLHQEVRSTHETLYNAYYFIKDLSSQHSGHIFLNIVQRQLSEMCGSLLSLLYELDNTKIGEGTLQNLRSIFSKFDSSDIFCTSQLRELVEKSCPGDYSDIEDPEKYEPKNYVIIEELTESENSDEESEQVQSVPVENKCPETSEFSSNRSENPQNSRSFQKAEEEKHRLHEEEINESRKERANTDDEINNFKLN